LAYPLLIHVLPVAPHESRIRVVINVSRKRFPRAVDRNLLKRRMREAYRLNRHLLTEKDGLFTDRSLHLSISYIGKEIRDYDTIREALIKLMRQLGG